MSDVRTTVRDVAYTVVGLGLLGFQRAQVQRRWALSRLEAAERQLPDEARQALRQVREAVREAGEQLGLRSPLQPGP